MKRLGVLALFTTVLAVVVLVGSMIAGLGPSEEVLPGASGGAGSVAEKSERIRVEVLNAAGVAGLARDATEKIRSAGFDVVYYGNAARFDRDSSVVLVRTGRAEAARSIAEVIDVPVVLDRPDSTLYLDVTVVIGRDWSGIPAAADTTTG